MKDYESGGSGREGGGLLGVGGRMAGCWDVRFLRSAIGFNIVTEFFRSNFDEVIYVITYNFEM